MYVYVFQEGLATLFGSTGLAVSIKDCAQQTNQVSHTHHVKNNQHQ